MDKTGTEFLEKKALIFDIKRDCSEDGPGIRTTVFFQRLSTFLYMVPKPGRQVKESRAFI